MALTIQIDSLPDLSFHYGMPYLTLLEAALLMGAIDFNKYGTMLDAERAEAQGLIHYQQLSRAKIALLSLKRGVCFGDLPFIEAWEIVDDWNRGRDYTKIEYGNAPSADTLAEDKTVIARSSLIAWCKKTGFMSVRREATINQSRGKNPTNTHETIPESTIISREQQEAEIRQLGLKHRELKGKTAEKLINAVNEYPDVFPDRTPKLNEELRPHLKSKHGCSDSEAHVIGRIVIDTYTECQGDTQQDKQKQ